MSKRSRVLVCGGGPCGLTVSHVLNQFGVDNILVEKHPGTSMHPKARGVNVRTMEFMRLWGLEENIRQYELDPKYRRIVWMDEIAGELLGEVVLNQDHFKHSPTQGCSVPQNHIEDALLESLDRAKYSDLRFSTELVDFVQREDHVLCHLLNRKTKDTTTIECDYLIGADGAHSPIRQKLAIPMHGVPSIGRYLTIYAHTDLSPWLHDEKLGVVYTFAAQKQMGRFLMAVDHKDKWIFGYRLEDNVQDVTEAYCKGVIRSFLNQDIDIKLISHSTWEMAALNAERYRENRVFLVGDAAHRMPPTGGMGMNTGFAGAQNLAWKLAYVLKGYADEAFLNTYQTERQPVASYTLNWSSGNAKRIFSMLDVYREGNIDAFKDLIADQTTHINHPGLDLGMIYQSKAVYSNEVDTVDVDPEKYEPSSTPGMRAPHCEIRLSGQNTSILSLFQGDYVLLLREEAEIMREALPIPDSFPLKTYRHTVDFDDVNDDFIQHYTLDKYKAVLVRPDGHIAWRG